MLDEAPSSDAYDAISERLQNLVQQAVLEPADGGAEIALLCMTCLVLGPIPDMETIDANFRHEDNFVPVAEWLSTQRS